MQHKETFGQGDYSTTSPKSLAGKMMIRADNLPFNGVRDTQIVIGPNDAGCRYHPEWFARCMVSGRYTISSYAGPIIDSISNFAAGVPLSFTSVAMEDKISRCSILRVFPRALFN